MNRAVVGADLFYHSSCDDVNSESVFNLSIYCSLSLSFVSVLLCVIIAPITGVLIFNALSMYMFVLYVKCLLDQAPLELTIFISIFP